ncbi:MAG TPA: hypothetical protein VEX35_01985 [Allosphingosinicella sp.]|nr:hypothetical protein [Allosphingosinicella sp.]
MQSRSAALFLAIALIGCGAPATAPAPYAMPALGDVLSSNMTDRSCACARDRQACAMVSDAVPGHFEGRGLQCAGVPGESGVVRCRFEERFVTENVGSPARPGPWQPRDGQFRRIAGGWCAG